MPHIENFKNGKDELRNFSFYLITLDSTKTITTTHMQHATKTERKYQKNKNHGKQCKVLLANKRNLRFAFFRLSFVLHNYLVVEK